MTNRTNLGESQDLIFHLFLFNVADPGWNGGLLTALLRSFLDEELLVFFREIAEQRLLLDGVLQLLRTFHHRGAQIGQNA